MQPGISIPKVRTGPEPNLPQTQQGMNDFSGGLKTEFHGLNFPPNAVTSEQNCRFTLQKEVVRRGGVDLEPNFASLTGTAGSAVNTYKWNNVGGDGQTQIIVTQTGGTLNFYLSSSATSSTSVSSNLLSTQTVTISNFLVFGSSNNPSTVECNFADGNGYLFVFNPFCEPFYCTYNSGTQTISSMPILVQIRDVAGTPEIGVPVNSRPATLTDEHNYNLQNQGWINNPGWSVASNTSFTMPSGAGNVTITVATGLTAISAGQSFNMLGTLNNPPYFTGNRYYGTVVSYTSGTGVLILHVTNGDSEPIISSTTTEINNSLITTWNSQIPGTYPSNADIWWYYNNSSGVFSPATTNTVGTASQAQAPQGSFVLPAFNLNRATVSGISSLTTIFTNARPSAGTWFQGRVWYTGVNANFQASGDAPYTTWTENIYFSQIVSNVTDFGSCYQQNDPTNQNLFDLLPTDGGTITIQGSGAIYELFPIQNGLIVRAANGIWFITGGQGIGFSATDYTITKISGVESIGTRPSANVLGFPVFCNQEGIWTVMPSQQGGGLVVDNIVLDTILTFYSNIPLASKQYIRSDYNPITYEIQWLYRSTAESSISNRYQFDTILCFNTHLKSFYHQVISQGASLPFVVGINFVQGPGGPTTPLPVFKYYVYNVTTYSFAQEYSSVYEDWTTQGNPTNYVSSFDTAYYLHSGGMRKFQPNYLYMYSRNTTSASYVVQAVWDFAVSNNSGRVSMRQQVVNGSSYTFQTSGSSPSTTTVQFFTPTYYGQMYRRHKLRGRGTVLQIQITSIDGSPFDFMGWAIWEVMNANP
jgi:hypothetical protein